MKYRRFYSLIMLAIVTGVILSCSGSGTGNAPGARDPKQVNLGISGNAIQVTSGADNEDQPAIAFDRNNTRYLTVWADYRSGNADVYGKLCDAKTAGFGLNAPTPVCGAEFLIADGGGSGNQWQPKVAFDYNSNKYLVVYADTSATYSQIYGRFISAAGVPDILGSFRISQHLDVADPSQIEPDVIYNDFRNTFTVGWLGTSNYDTVDYPAASPVASSFTPTWKSGYTTTIVNANAIVSVTLPGGTPLTNYTVSPANPDATNSTSVLTINSSSNVIGTSGDLTVTYADSSKTNDGTTTALTGGPPTVFAANDSFSISPLAPQTDLALAYLFFNSNHSIAATSTQQVANSPNVNVAILAGSNLIGQHPAYWTSFQKSPYTWKAPMWQSGSSIIINNVYSQANTLPYGVTITDSLNVNRTADFDIAIGSNTLVATLKAGSTLISHNPTVTVNYTPIKNLIGPVTGSICFNSYGPIPFSPSSHVGTSLVAYRDVDAAGILGTVQGYSEAALISNVDDGSSSITIVWNINEDETKPKVVFNPLDGESFMLWSGTQVNETLKISYKDLGGGNCSYTSAFSKGTNTSQKIVLRRLINSTYTDTLLGNSAFFPAISIDPTAKRMLIAWEEQSSATFASTGKDISAQLFDLTNFVMYGSLIKVSNAVGDQTSPVAAFDTVNQRHLIIWEDARNQSANISNIDLYGQFIDPQGNLSGGNVPINVDQGNQLSPALAFGDVNFRQFFIIWKNGVDPSNADIWGQLLKYSTLPQLVIADSNGNPILNGALDFGNVPVGSFKDIPIKLRNDGNTVLTISSMSSPDAPFSFVTPKPVSINPGTIYDMTIRFSPMAAGSYTTGSSNNFFTSIASNGGNTVLYFSGSGVGINPLSITTPSLPDAGTIGAYSYQIVAAGGVFPYSWSATGLPAALSINASTGIISGSNPVAGSYTVTVTVSDSNTPANSASRAYTLNVGAVSITSTTLSSWTQGVDYSSAPLHTLTAAGGTAPYSWAVVSGALPPGIGPNIPASGILSGKPTGSGVYSFTVRVTDSAGVPQTAQSTLSITINPTPTILTTSLSNGVVGLSYAQTLSMTGGTLPISWSLSGGLPPGLTFNTGSGAISGIPTTKGTFTLNFTVTDASGAVDTKQLAITVNSALGISTPTSGAGAPDPATVNTPYTFTFKTNDGGIAPYTWSVVNGALPLGMALNANTGIIFGTPTVPGNYTFTMQVQDVNGTVVQKTYTIVASMPVTVTTASLPNWTVNSTLPYSQNSQTLAATGGNGAYVWSITAGSGFGTLSPIPGLTLNAASGAITGTPTTSGTYTFTVTATDGSSPALTGSKQFTVTINPPLVITNSALADGIKDNITYNQTLLSVGGTPPVRWAVSGSLPAGLYLDALTGVISGLPTAVTATPTPTFVVSATDAGGMTVTKTLSIKIVTQPSPVSITTASIATMTTGTALDATYKLAASGGASTTYTWSLIGGTLPSGVVFGSDGTLSGTPTAKGTYTISVQVSDSSTVPLTAVKNFTFVVIDPLTVATTSVLPQWDKDRANYSTRLVAAGGTGPFIWSLSGGTTLPPSLSLDTVTGIISGTPTATGTSTFTVAVVDSTVPQQTATKSLSITITAAMAVSSNLALSPDMYVGTPAGFALTATNSTASVVWSSTALPAGLVLNTATGAISGTPTTAAITTVIFTATDSDDGRTASSTLSLVVNGPVTVSTATLPGWTSGQPYSQTLVATGGLPYSAVGTSPYTWSRATGSFPAGIDFDILTTPGQTLLKGTPTAAGSYTFTLKATDKNGVFATSATYTLVINPAMAMVTGASLPDGTNGALYSQPLTLFGGTAPYTWSIGAVGALPGGVNIDALTGALTGVATTAGTFNFTVHVVDASGATLNAPMTINIIAPLGISTASLLNGVVGSTYPSTTFAITAAVSPAPSARTPLIWNVSGGALPVGLSLSGTGLLSGTPTVAGLYNVTVKVTDADNRTATRDYTFTIFSPVSVTTTSLPNLTVGRLYSQTLTAAGGDPYTGAASPYTWSVATGSPPLPVGVAFDTATTPGQTLLRGTPTATGSYTFTLKATDKDGAFATSVAYTVVINPAMAITTGANLPDGTSGMLYSQPLALFGGTAPYTWSISSGALPAGVAIDTMSGALAGVATTAGAYHFTVTVVDANGANRDTPMSIAIIDPLSIDTAVSVPGGAVATPFANTTFKVTATTPAAKTPLTWSISGGALPTGLVLSSTGILSGTPSAAGLYNFTVKVTDADGRSATSDYAPTIFNPVTISTITLASGMENRAGYSQSLVATGGSGTYTWSLANGTLPPGLSVTGAGVISGTPTLSGSYGFTVTATDNNAVAALTVSKHLAIVIAAADSSISTGSPNTPPPASSGGSKSASGCFIATAAYGSYLEPHVMVLRHFRDDVLLQSKAGTAFVKLYYTYSPPVADFIAQHDSLRMVVRFFLTPLIFAVKYPLVSALLLCMLAWFGGAALIRRVRNGNNTVVSELV